MRALTAAPREADLGDGCATQSKGHAHADAALQSFETEIARLEGDLSELTEDAEPQRIDDLALVADLVGDQIWSPEAVVVIAPQEVLVVDVSAAQCGLEIKGDPVPRVR